mgnify:CR=1 FL=1
MSNHTPDQDVDVAAVARLARLSLADDECERMQAELSDIVSYIRKLQQLDLTDIEPTAHAAAITNVLRADAAGDCQPQEQTLANAPATVNDDLIRVPEIIGHGLKGGA